MKVFRQNPIASCLVLRLIRSQSETGGSETPSNHIAMNTDHSEPLWNHIDWINHTRILLNSFRQFVGRELIDRSGTQAEQARRLFEAPFVVVSHGIQQDPILNYGNQTALSLWEVDAETFLKMPSRLTAEPMHRDERARLLERTSRDGFVDDYKGIRISSSGRRFLIEQAIVWNLINERGERVGQAATFDHWQFL